MDISDKDAMAADLDLICAVLGVRIDATALRRYQHRAYLDLAHDEKRTALERNVLLAAAWREQSLDSFYEIYPSARAVPLMRKLARAIRATEGRRAFEQVARKRLRRLAGVVDDDTFENQLFELLAFAAYNEAPEVRYAEFVDEDPQSKTPDLRVFPRSGGEYFAECKRAARRTDFAAGIRAGAKEPARVLFEVAHEDGRSVRWRLILKEEPAAVPLNELSADGRVLLAAGGAIVRHTYTLACDLLRAPDLSASYRLIPGPQYYEEQYGYAAADGEWHGIDCLLEASWRGAFVDKIKWECAVVWKLANEELVWRHTRLPFDLVFKGLKQLNVHSASSVLHFQYERADNFGHRKQFLDDLIGRLKKNPDQRFRWLVFNEVEYAVSREGRFAHTEHAHFINGEPMHDGRSPDVTTIHTTAEDHKTGCVPAWGMGTTLADIDTE